MKEEKTVNGFKAAYDAWKRVEMPTTNQSDSAASKNAVGVEVQG